jgi:XFP N-terminal domain
VLARISRQELIDLIHGYGYEPHFVEHDVPAVVHQSLASALDRILAEIQKIQKTARTSPDAVKRPRWPMIVFRTPKGWTGPKLVDGKPVEGTWRAHQVPIAHLENPEHLKQLIGLSRRGARRRERAARQLQNIRLGSAAANPLEQESQSASAALRFLDQNPPDLEEVREALRCVANDAGRAGDIIGRIRDHIRKAPVRKDSFELNEAINEVIALARSEI